MKRQQFLAIAAVLVLGGARDAAAQAERPPAQTPAWTASLGEIRRVATMIPGNRPLRINMLKFAESRRTKNFAVQGAPAEPSVQARTVFQVVFANGYVMVDSGMDEPVHKFFGRGLVEPYDAAAARRVEEAVRGARSIVLTHEHGDHAGGVIRGPSVEEIARKTVLTREQVRALLSEPQMPEIRLTPALASQYIVVDYEKYLPYAPGFVLIKAPGHTTGSQMVYVVLESGREYLLTGDAAWHMDGIRLMKGKDAPWVREDAGAITAQLKWLNEIDRTERNVVIVVSHDDEQHKQLVDRGLLGGALE
jgi:glyoxylase-like metal-dependent hydrolase (beta-lactamase superfamily II)